MSADPRAERERILERLLTGELDPDGQEGRQLLERDPTLRVELEALRAVEGAIDEAAGEREPIEGLAVEDGDEARVRSVLDTIWKNERRPPTPRPWGHLGWLGLAAGLLFAAALGYTFLGGREPEPVDPTELGGGRLECREPIGEVERYGTFYWIEGLPPGYTFDLIIRDGAGEVRHRVLDLAGDSWTAPPETAAELPASIRWSILARTPLGDVATRSLEVRARIVDR